MSETTNDDEYTGRPQVAPKSVHYIGRTRTGRARHLVDRTHDQLNPQGQENTRAECGRVVTVTEELWDGTGHWHGCEACEMGAIGSRRVRRGALRYRMVPRRATVAHDVIDMTTMEVIHQTGADEVGRELAERRARELNDAESEA